MARTLLVVCVSCTLFGLGCNRTSPLEAEIADQGTLVQADHVELAQTSAIPAATSKPDQIVAAFLVALRDGDDAVAEALLTDKAREETAQHDLVVEPPGSPNADFHIGETEFVDANQTGAHVKSIWSERDGQGEVSYELVWALRHQADGWRIAGMATEIVAGQRPVFLNFEDPSDMLEKMKRAERIAARHQEATRNDASIRR